MKQHPRYNVVSCRVSDATRKRIDESLAGRSVQAFVHAAIEEKLINDLQDKFDTHLRAYRNKHDKP